MEFVEDYNLTELQRDFIGGHFTTPLGGDIYIIGKLKKTDLYASTCSICSKDRELFKGGVIPCKKFEIEKGKIPCMCNPRYKLNYQQKIILAERRCAKDNYTLNSIFTEDENTWCDVTCNITKSTNKRMALSLFLSGKNIRARDTHDRHHEPLRDTLGNKTIRICGNSVLITCKVCSEDIVGSVCDQHKIFLSKFYKVKTFKCRCERNLTDKEINDYIEFRNKVGGIRFIKDYHPSKYLPLQLTMHSTVSKLVCKRWVDGIKLKCKVRGTNSTLNKVQSFINASNRFANGTKVIGVSGTDVLIICPVCKNDELAKAGLCNGEFTAKSYTLCRDAVPCRCCNNYKLSIEQEEFLIKSRLKRDGKSFKGWINTTTKNCYSKFKIMCRKGTTGSTSITNYKTRGYKCKCCGETVHGFDNNTPSYFYVVKWKDTYDDTCWIKCGITNRSTYDRIRQQSNKSGCILSYEVILSMRVESGVIAKKLEEDYKTKYCINLNNKDKFPDGWTETSLYSEEILDKILINSKKYFNLIL